MKMEDQTVIDDALELCTAVLNKLDVGMVLIAREAGSISELGRVSYIYNNFKTPYLLQSEGLATVYIIDLPNIPKGSFRAVFDLDKVQEWTSKKLDMQPETAKDVWKTGFRFTNDTLYLPPFGRCSFSTKNLPTGAKTNQRALLVGVVFSVGEDGANANMIRKEFSKRGLPEPSNRTIDAMITAINQRFSKDFQDAVVVLKNIGEGKSKRVKLSVRPIK